MRVATDLTSYHHHGDRYSSRCNYLYSHDVRVRTARHAEQDTPIIWVRFHIAGPRAQNSANSIPIGSTLNYRTCFFVGAMFAFGCGEQPGLTAQHVDAASATPASRVGMRVDPVAELVEATADAVPDKLVRRDGDAGALFGPVAVSRLRVQGGVGGAQFASARADVPTMFSAAAEHKFRGWLVGNHIELPLASGVTTTILEPVGYPPGSELKLWATQDATGGCGLRFSGAFVDHAGRGFAPLNTKPGAVDFYHFYLRPSGEWWLEEHQ
jgi:hypothetical protein